MIEQNHPRGYIPPEHPESEKKQRRQMFVIFGVVVVLIGLIIACGFSIANMGENLSTEMEGINTTLDGFMVAMADKNVEKAADFLTKSAANKLAETLPNMVNGSDYALFEGYQSMKVESFKVNTTVGNMPSSIANATYKLEYVDGTGGRLIVKCEKRSDEWQIASIQIEKFAGSFTSP